MSFLQPLSESFFWNHIRTVTEFILYYLFSILIAPARELTQRVRSLFAATDGLTDRQKWAWAWIPESERVVDIGSSTSPLLAVLHRKSKNVVALDTDRSALSLLSQAFPEILILESSAAAIPLQSGSCDTALLLDVLEHVDDEQGTINEAHRILRPNGTLILSVPHKGLFRFLDPQNLKAKLTGQYSKEREHRHYSDKEIRRLLGMKFEVIRKHLGGLFLYPLTFAANNFIQKNFRWDGSVFFKKLGDWDNDISWGVLSYNLIILARRI